MDDRTLLEAAAKAAGIRLEWDGDPRDWQPMYYEGKTYHVWNPLTDDGDALRLAVKLKVCFVIDNFMKWCGVHLSDKMGKYDLVEHFDDWADAAEATRRAIVRAAAAIGGAKP
jgi:hypothetical protein